MRVGLCPTREMDSASLTVDSATAYSREKLPIPVRKNSGKDQVNREGNT